MATAGTNIGQCCAFLTRKTLEQFSGAFFNIYGICRFPALAYLFLLDMFSVIRSYEFTIIIRYSRKISDSHGDIRANLSCSLLSCNMSVCSFSAKFSYTLEWKWLFSRFISVFQVISFFFVVDMLSQTLFIWYISQFLRQWTSARLYLANGSSELTQQCGPQSGTSSHWIKKG